ncbi:MULTISPECIES: recombinase family protein [Vibrio]|uniref:Recombinase family protein n=1 Tax=Vibrio alginolyticus TaxID=663 RepID=A0A7Y0MTZ0_VIBAL|nr:MULTISPECIES: recombinase family protein [Vibrio]HCG6120365.1 recombinase family protein [Vibrio parahaemolyticus]MCR9988773.1 recombinase family protein [Vibrio antiquarius]MDW2200691.1 recombinase family protein [Vibrio sp. 1636]NMR72650.1 recombinase family protein [Vibrio alginolyticus]HCG6123665.1 recombinase family protein [Vibrio parahaemolyticus]
MIEEKQRFAVTYQRFSSGRQIGNSSLDRQTDTQKAWLRQNPNVTVIDNFVDEAMSGWSGKHLKEGSLGQLMKAIEEGIIQPGTLILVEHFSRLTRQNIDNAEELVKRIWKAGITLVTVRDNTEYPPEAVNNMSLRIRLIVEMEQAFRESEWRSAKVKASYTRREKLAKEEGKAPRIRKPFWLNPDGTLNHLHQAVKDMFNWYLEGLGQQRIVVRLREKYPDTAIQKINPSTVMRWIQSEIVRGYWRGNRVYEPAVDDQLFFDVQTIHKSRLYKNVKPDRQWPLSGLMQCGVCGRGMSIQKSGKSSPVVRCSSKQRDRSCHRKTTFPYFIVHMYMMTHVLHRAIRLHSDKSSNKGLQIDLGKVERKLATNRKKLNDEKEFYNKASNEGQNTTMILQLMNETYQKVAELEEQEKSLKASLKQNNHSVSSESRDLVLTPETFNLEMHKLGFKIVVGEQVLSTIGFDKPVPKLAYAGYCRKKRAYKYATGSSDFLHVWPSSLVTDELLNMQNLKDYINSSNGLRYIWDNLYEDDLEEKLAKKLNKKG